MQLPGCHQQKSANGWQTTGAPNHQLSIGWNKKDWKNHGKYQLRRNTLWISNHNFTSPIVELFHPTSNCFFLGETPHFVGTTSRFPSVNTHPFSPDNGPVASLQGRSSPGNTWDSEDVKTKKKTRVPRPETGRFLGPIFLWEFWGFYLGGSSHLGYVVNNHGWEVQWLAFFMDTPIIYRVFIHPRWLFGISEPSTFVTKNFRYLKWRVSWSLFSAVLGMGKLPYISRIHTAYIGEDSSILGTWNVWWYMDIPWKSKTTNWMIQIPLP